MLTKECKARLADFFESHDLVELLRLETSDVIEAFEDDVEEALEDLEDIMGVHDEDD